MSRDQPEMSLAQRLDATVAIAQAAGTVLLDHRGRDLAVDWKGPIDPVSSADHAAQHIITDRLDELFPGEPVLSEEDDVGMSARELSGRAYWCVDPLDGTVNYLHHGDRFAVSIAYVAADGSTLIAVVHVPARRETFTAQRGQGAFLNDAVIRCSTGVDLSRALVASGFPYDVHDSGGNLDAWAVVTRRALSMRSLGAAAVELCDVACGRLDAFWEPDLSLWDTAAGVLIAREAGAVATDLDDRPVGGPTESVLVAGARTHQQLLQVIRQS